MVQPIQTNVMFLQLKAERATPADISVAQDLVDTLNANEDRCVGLAANMIGSRKAIICVRGMDGSALVMLNPKITEKGAPYETKEGCLCFSGVRKATRYRHIKVSYQDVNGTEHEASFFGLPAEAIQHEMDHLQGILI
jgi:peptide deformylase